MEKLFIIYVAAYLPINTSAFSQFTKLLDFAGVTNGTGPSGSLISDGTFLYGMATYCLQLSLVCPILPEALHYYARLTTD